MDEKESCAICTEPYNKVSHKKIMCSYCPFTSCHRCIQTYILSQINQERTLYSML